MAVRVCLLHAPLHRAAVGRLSIYCSLLSSPPLVPRAHTLTHAAPPFSSPQGDWLKLGFMLSIYYILVWGTCSMTVWKAIGVW